MKKKLQVGAENVVMIGNSLSSDIKPSLLAGIKAIHLIRDTWAFDHADINNEDANYYKVLTYEDILQKLAQFNFIDSALTIA